MNTLTKILIDTTNIRRITASRGEFAEVLQVPLVEECLFKFELVDEDKNPVSYGAGVWEFGIDNSTDISETSLVYTTGNFNASNWSEESYTNGKVSVVANIHTEEMVAALEAEEEDTENTSISAIAELWFTPSGGTRTLVAQFPVGVENIVLDGSSPVPGSAPRVVTTTSGGVLVSPANLWTTNATGIYDAISGQIGEDSLGNHTATQTLNMAGFNVTGVGGLSASSITGDISNSTLNTGNWNGNLAGVTNTVKAALDAIDNFTLGTSDNLGNHTATQALNMSGFDINSAGNVNGNTGNFSTLLGQASNVTALGSVAFTGNFASFETNTELKYYLDAIDAFPIGQGGGGTVSELKLSSPFNYMNLSKAFGTGTLGWTTEEEDLIYCYSAGGYESSTTSSMQSGTVWLDMAIPYGATGFAPTGCLDVTFVADTGSSAFNKLDITYITSSGNMTNNSTRFTTGSWCPSSAGVPEVFTLNSSDLLNSTLSGHSRAKLKIEWYSISGYSIKMIDGALNFVG